MGKIFFGLGLIILALFLVLDGMGVFLPTVGILGEISVWQILGGLLLLSYVIQRLIKLKPISTIIPLALLFMVFERNIAVLCGRSDHNIISNWLLLLCAVLLEIGLSMIFRQNRIVRFKVKHKDDRFTVDGVEFEADGSDSSEVNMGSNTVYIDCTDFTKKNVSNNIGSCNIRFENAALYKGGGQLVVENNMGATVINVPSSWRVKCKLDNNLGHVSCKGDGDPNGPELIIKGENNLGSLRIVLI